MVEVLIEYGLFLAKAVTIVVAIILVFGGVAATSAMSRSRQTTDQGDIKVVDMVERFDEMEETLKEAVLSKEELKEEAKAQKKKDKAAKKALKDGKESKDTKKRIFVLDFDGDVQASEVEELRDVISAVLTLATPTDEVVLRLESPGGQVHGYGLASSQLHRITAANIPLTICVDKVAASGGYMMACHGQKIIAAPFAIIGSVGVVAELPNFNRVLKKHDVDYDVYTAGEYKRTVTVLGENTEEGIRKFNEELEETHELFKNHVSTHRPQLDLSRIATGEHWYGSQALALDLVDELSTSDDYLFAQRKDAKIYELSLAHKRTFVERLGLNVRAVESLFERVLMRVWHGLSGSQNRK